MQAEREFVDKELTKHLPKWRVLANETKADALDRILVRVSNKRVRRLADAPLGAYEHTVDIRLTSNQTDVARAETDLEAALDSLLAVIEEHLAPLGVLWDEAEKVLDPDSQTLAWDVPVRLITTRSE